MRKTKKLLSVLLAMIMVCSTIVIGAQAAYSNYKDDAIANSYDSIDKPSFTAAQLSSVALDEIDRMLMEMGDTYIKVPIINAPIDYSSVDKALDSLQNIYNGSAWATVTSIAGDLGGLNFKALNTDSSSKNFAAEGCRRTTAGKTDLDVLYSLINFLYDNKGILASYGYGTLDIGATLSGLLPSSVMDYFDAPKLLKGIIYKMIYKVDEAPDTITESVDSMLQKLADDQLADLEVWAAKSAGYGLTFDFSNVVSINSGSVYDTIENVLQLAYNQVLVPLANTKVKGWLFEQAGAKFSELQRVKAYVYDKNGNAVLDESGNQTTQFIGYYLDDTAAIQNILNEDNIYDRNAISVYDANAGKLNVLDDIMTLNYTIPTYNFNGKQIVNEANNILGTWVNALLTSKNPNLTWTSGDNSNIIPNIVGIAKQLLKQYGERYLSEYITIPSDEEIDALTFETAFVRFGKELVEKFEVYSLLPESANSVRSILTYALLEIISERVPSQDIYAQLESGELDPNTDAGWKAILAIFARYYANAYTNMNIPEGLTFDETISFAVDWALNTYGGILDFTSHIDPNKSAWKKFDEAIFTLIPMNWLPSQVRVLENGAEKTINVTGSEDLVMKFLIGNILDLKFDYLLDILQRNPSGELTGTPTAVVLGRVRSILNAIIPGTLTTQYTTFESILTKQSFGDIIDGLFTGINTVKVNLITSALPLVCQILKLTTDQQIDDPLIVYPDTIINASRTLGSTSITIRNNSSGVNTGYTDANGNFSQDALYKVKIKSITTNNSGVNVTYTANETLNGGVTKTFPVSGSLSADGLVRFAVSYEILDETGTSLTSSPITVYFFTYVSTTLADNDKDNYAYDQDGYPLFSVDGVGMNSHYIVSAPAAYISSWGQLSNQSYDIGRELTSDSYMNAESNVSYVSFSSTMPGAVLSAPEFPTFKTTFGGYYGSKDLAKVTVPQIDDPDNAGQTINDDFTKYLGTYDANLKLHFTATQTGDPAVDYTVSRKLYLFNDYNLPGIVSDALGANRQASNYATSGTFNYTEKVVGEDGETETNSYTANASTAWSNYLNALTAAESILLKPKTMGTFDATVYEAAAANLKRAIADLDACVLSAGVASLEALREGVEPENAEDANYDDAGYNFFGAEDYVLYTYERYKTHRSNMDKLINSQYVTLEAPTEPEEGASAAEIAAYNKALAEYNEAYQKAVDAIPTLKLFDITYRGHMYEMNANRLIRVPASKNYLTHSANTVNLKVLSLNSEDYTPESWGILVRAQNFAASVLADNSSDLRQSKVNSARRELIFAYKSLELKGADPADYTQLDAAIASADAIYEEENYTDKYTGLDALAEAYNAAKEVARDLLIDSQTIVDAAAQALTDALGALGQVEAGVAPVETIPEIYGDDKPWAPTFSEFTGDLNAGEKYICGLLVDYYDGIESLVGTTGGATYEYTPNDNNGGTLATSDYITLDDGTVYYIVIYGDCTGDGLIDSYDANEAGYMSNWESEFSAPGDIFSTAADVFADGAVDVFDLDTLGYLANYEIDPTTFPQDGSYAG